ncbi:MAG: hypothetical protein ACO3S3_11740 [Pseudohongiellaceae bacterium]
MAEYKQPQSVPVPTVTSRLTANDVNMSVGSISRRDQGATKTSGVKIRGTGAATKGTMARGPMA